jgi:hypothetical protein
LAARQVPSLPHEPGCVPLFLPQGDRPADLDLPPMGRVPHEHGVVVDDEGDRGRVTVCWPGSAPVNKSRRSPGDVFATSKSLGGVEVGPHRLDPLPFGLSEGPGVSGRAAPAPRVLGAKAAGVAPGAGGSGLGATPGRTLRLAAGHRAAASPDRNVRTPPRFFSWSLLRLLGDWVEEHEWRRSWCWRGPGWVWRGWR